MRIALTRSGGFAGLTLRNEVDTAHLPAADRHAIEELAAAARAAPLPRESPAHPDSIAYEVDIDGKAYVLHDGKMPAAWAQLIDRMVLLRTAAAP